MSDLKYKEITQSMKKIIIQLLNKQLFNRTQYNSIAIKKLVKIK